MEAPPAGWYRFLVPPGAVSLALETPGEANLYVDGMEIAAEKTGAGYTAVLSNPESPSRVAALRIQSVCGFEEGAALLAPIRFEMAPGRISLGSWDELGLPHYAGGIVYMAEVELAKTPSGKAILDLGRVRGSVDVTVNGIPCGVRLWHPYRFAIGEALRAGKNTIEVRAFNTLGPHFDVGHPSQHVFKNHGKSGVFGPISLTVLDPVTLELQGRSA